MIEQWRTTRWAVDFTGPASHQVQFKQGYSLKIAGADADLVVDDSDALHWDVLSDPDVIAPWWPNLVSYRGADTSVVEWSKRHAMSELMLFATAPMSFDLRGTLAHYVNLEPAGGTISARVSGDAPRGGLRLSGDLDAIVIEQQGAAPLGLVMVELDALAALPRRKAPPGPPRALPATLGITRARELNITTHPNATPFDARSLADFADLESLMIHGAVVHLEALAALPLRSLGLRYVPDASSLPALSTWSDLDSVVIWNSDAATTKRIRRELRTLPPSESFRSATLGRSAAWFATECGLPFSGWPRAAAARAKRAFMPAAAQMRAATSAADAIEAIDAFVTAANTLPNVMTAEREDLSEAVALLADMTEHIDQTAAAARFDALRDF